MKRNPLDGEEQQAAGRPKPSNVSPQKRADHGIKTNSQDHNNNNIGDQMALEGQRQSSQQKQQMMQQQMYPQGKQQIQQSPHMKNYSSHSEQQSRNTNALMKQQYAHTADNFGGQQSSLGGYIPNNKQPQHNSSSQSNQGASTHALPIANGVLLNVGGMPPGGGYTQNNVGHIDQASGKPYAQMAGSGAGQASRNSNVRYQQNSQQARQKMEGLYSTGNIQVLNQTYHNRPGMQPTSNTANTGSSSMSQLQNVKMTGALINLGGTGNMSQPKHNQNAHALMGMTNTSSSNAYNQPSSLQNTKVNFHNQKKFLNQMNKVSSKNTNNPTTQGSQQRDAGRSSNTNAKKKSSINNGQSKHSQGIPTGASQTQYLQMLNPAKSPQKKEVGYSKGNQIVQSNSVENIIYTTAGGGGGGGRTAHKIQGQGISGMPQDSFSPPKQSFKAQSSQKLPQYHMLALPNNNTQNSSQLNAFTQQQQQQQQNKTQIFQSRSNSQQPIQSNMNPSLKQKNKIKQNQQLEGQINIANANVVAAKQRNAQKLLYDYDLTYHDNSTNGVGMNTTGTKGFSKKTSSGSVPLKYGSDTRADGHDQKNQMVLQAMPTVMSRNNHNMSNMTNQQNQTLYTNISLREISHSPDAAARRDDQATEGGRITQPRKPSSRNKRGKKIQITSGKHGGLLNLQNTNMINNQKQLNRTGGAASVLGNLGSGNLLQNNTQAPIDLNMSHLSHNMDPNQSFPQMSHILHNQRLYANNSELGHHNMMVGGQGRAGQNQESSQGLELRQYLANINSAGSNNRNNGGLAQIPELIQNSQQQQQQQQQYHSHYMDQNTANNNGNKQIGIRSNSEGVNNKSGSQNNPILNIKTVQDINIQSMLVFMNTNNQNMQNMPTQAQLQQLQMQQQLLNDQQNQFQQQINAQVQAANNGVSGDQVIGGAKNTSGEQGVIQSTNRTTNNKRVLKLRKELSGVSTGFNQSRSASQGRPAIITGANGGVQAQNPGNQFAHTDTHKSKSQHAQNANQFEVDGGRNLGHGLQNMRVSKGHDAYNSKQSLPGNGSHENHSQYSNQSKNNRNAMQHILSQQQQQNLKNLAQNPNQKRVIGNPHQINKYFANQGGQVINKNANFSALNSSNQHLNTQSHKQKLNNLNQQIGYSSGYHQNPKTMKQGSSVKKVGKGDKSSSTSRIQSRTDSHNGGMHAQNQSNEMLDHQQLYQSLGKGMMHLPKGNLIKQHELAARNTVYNQNNQQQQQIYQTGSRAQSFTNQTQKMGSRMIDMNNGEDRNDLNQSNMSYMTGGDISDAQLHSKSQVIQYSKNSSSGQFPSQNLLPKGNQVINLNSYEVRKQSLQDLKSQNFRMMSGQNGQNLKFRNQLQQFSSDNDGLTPQNESGTFSNQQNGPHVIGSMSLKNDSALFLNRGGIMNRVKTQDAFVTDNLINQGTPARQRQDKIAQKALNDIQEKGKNYTQLVMKIKKQLNDLKDRTMNESEIKVLEKQLDQLAEKYDQFRVQIQEGMIQAADFQNLLAQIQQVEEKAIDQQIEIKLIKAVSQADQGCNHESIRELDNIIEENGNRGSEQKQNEVPSESWHNKGKNHDSKSSDQLLQMRMNPQGSKNSSNDRRQQFCILLKSIIQRRIGEHEQCLLTVTECINKYPDFKDAYLVRGQINLLQKRSQKAVQDFIEFNSLASQDLNQVQQIAPTIQKNQQTQGSKNQQSPADLSQLLFQVAIGQELLGDAYKKMKKYKLANKCYEQSVSEIQKIKLNKNCGRTIMGQADVQINKLKLKIAMCAYYQGEMQRSTEVMQEVANFYKGYNFETLKVQQKQIKANFYIGKAILSQIGQDLRSGLMNYGDALKYLNFCCKDEIDPEVHELYSGNAFFEISKVFLKQRDILNAYDYIQRANDNNYSSKRMSLYRDFTEGVVYLMKRKIKKGVQILTDLLEILINGQKEIQKNIQLKNKEKKENKAIDGLANKDRYNVNDSDLMDPAKAKNIDLILTRDDLSVDNKSTLNAKANQIASGKFCKEMYEYLIFNIYIYRSYGYVAIEKYEHALEDLRKAKRISPYAMDKATIYNKWLSRGILKMDTEEYLMASKYFSKASLRFPGNKDAFCLNVISIVRSYTFSLQDKFIDDQAKFDKVKQTKEFLNVAIECCCKEQKQASLYFFRGLLNFQMHDFYAALSDFNVAIQEEEEATGQFHLARGRTYACLSILDEALKDLSVALELDESLLEAYIFRGKCAYLLGDNNLAFHDFQKLIISDQKNPLVHIYAGNLLMTTGAYTDAIKAFDNADTVQPTALASFQRIRCYCALSDLEKAFEQMQLCKHQAPNEKFAQYDYRVLLSMLSCVRSFEFIKGENGQIDDEGLQQHREILLNCIAQISQIIETYEKNEQLQLKKGQSPMSVQIIPNVNKIKIEKKYVLRHIGKNAELPDLTASEQKALAGAERTGYYRENIFQLEDMYLYRGIFQMYLGNNDEALRNITKSWNNHIMAKRQVAQDGKSTKNTGKKIGIDGDDGDEMYGRFSASQLVSPINSVHSHGSQRTDLSDIGLCSLNIRELNYNLIIIHIQNKNWDQALQIINKELTESLQNTDLTKNVKQLYLVRAMIYQELGQTDKFNQDLTIYLKNFQKIQKNNLGTVVIEPFDIKGRLCEQFEPIKMNFTKQKAKGSFTLSMRPSFSMPFIKPPNMIPNIDEEAIQNEFNLKQIDAPMPEAPWNRQCQFQDFQGQGFLREENDNSTDEQLQSHLPKLPADLGDKMFLHKYKDFRQDKNSQALFDHLVMADIDDLSDTEKVSLISDMELKDMASQTGGSIQNSSKKTNKNAKKEQDSNMLVVEDGKDGSFQIDQSLNLKNLKDLTKENEPNAKRVPNGIKITRQKYLCRQRRQCSSCYRLPMNPDSLNIANQETLLKNLRMHSQDGQKQRLGLHKGEDYIPTTASQETHKKNMALIKKILPQREVDFEDTVSEPSSSSDGNSESETNRKKDKNAKPKKKPTGSHQNSGSKYTHSRFSSNVEELEVDVDGEIDEKHATSNGKDKLGLDIDMTDVEVNEIKGLGPQGKQLVHMIEQNEKKKQPTLSKKDKRMLNNKFLEEDTQITENSHKEKIFNQHIGSIQRHDDQVEILSPSAQRHQQTPPQHEKRTEKLKKLAGKPKDSGLKGKDPDEGAGLDERESMVIMGSINMKRGGAIGPGGKKSSKKVTGIGGTANLKRNKLAIAFNNLEVEHNDKD